MKLDLGCGHAPEPDFIGVDIVPNEHVSVIADLRERWPWDDNSIAEVHCSHLIEHLHAHERVHFANELYRVLVPSGEAKITAPHWSSCKAYGDVTHVWPPVSEFWFAYLSRAWREEHTDADSVGAYKCDFEVRYTFGVDHEIFLLDDPIVQVAMLHYRDAVTDIVSTWKSLKN